jgi:myo-inositol-1(or 4)-monophosphatase
MSLETTTLRSMEEFAVELANLAGAEIIAAFNQPLMIEYKHEAKTLRDPVSEIDRKVEAVIRDRLAQRFPNHGVLGEEMEDEVPATANIVWAVDPIDGTSNFINGFPWFSASIGALHRGVPVVGALWCSASHVLRSGVYHGCSEGVLRFDGEPAVAATNALVRRRLAGDPRGGAPEAPWESRKTGSAAMECAFVALGLLQVVRFERPNIWDVAGGIALARAAGRTVLMGASGGWVPFDRFPLPGSREADAGWRDWRPDLLLGEPEAIEVAKRVYRPT